MVVYGLFFTAELYEVSEIDPTTVPLWRVSVTCTSCKEANPAPVTINLTESFAIQGSRGEANVVMKCKFCKHQGTIRVVEKSVAKYTSSTALNLHPFCKLECRGIQIDTWYPGEGWKLYAASNSSNTWSDVDLSDDWVEYCDILGSPVSITDLEAQVRRMKD